MNLLTAVGRRRSRAGHEGRYQSDAELGKRRSARVVDNGGKKPTETGIWAAETTECRSSARDPSPRFECKCCARDVRVRGQKHEASRHASPEERVDGNIPRGKMSRRSSGSIGRKGKNWARFLTGRIASCQGEAPAISQHRGPAMGDGKKNKME